MGALQGFQAANLLLATFKCSSCNASMQTPVSLTFIHGSVKFKMAELLPLKMHLFTSIGFPKLHWL